MPRGTTAMIAVAAAALLCGVGCGPKGKGAKHPDGGKGGEGSKEGEWKATGPIFEKKTTLDTIQVLPVDPEDADDLAGDVEALVAFGGIGKLADCEKSAGGPTFTGTIGIEFKIDPTGHVPEDPVVAITTSPEVGELEKCLAKTVQELDFTTIHPESTATFHLKLKYAGK